MKRAKKLVPVVTAHVRHFLKKSRRDNVPALAGQSAFFIILSAAPLLVFFLSVVSLITGKDPGSLILPTITDIHPSIRSFVSYLAQSVHESATGVAIVTAIAVLWSAGRGLYCITDGISRIYGVRERRLWVFRRVHAMGYTLIMLPVLLLGVVFLTANSYLSGELTALLGGSSAVRWITSIVFCLAFGVFQAVVMALALKLYLRRRVRDRRFRSVRALLPGMLLTVAAWMVLNGGVGLYMRCFAASSIYGSLGSVLVIILWIYFMMYILLYGVQLNYIYRSRFADFLRRKKPRGQLPDPSTIP